MLLAACHFGPNMNWLRPGYFCDDMGCTALLFLSSYACVFSYWQRPLVFFLLFRACVLMHAESVVADLVRWEELCLWKPTAAAWVWLAFSTLASVPAHQKSTR